MTTRHHLAGRLEGRLAGAGVTLVLSLPFAVGLAGCHRKVVRSPFPASVLAPIELEAATNPNSMPLIASIPPPELGPPTQPPPFPKPVARKRPAAKEEAPAPAQAASAPESAALAIGALSIGGDAAPQSQQTARDLIGTITRRIAALPAKTASAQKAQIRQIRHFLDQAQQALNSGDSEGAMNLATKAKLLMDDLEKK